MEWTKEQKRIIDLRDRNILVSAAAGSGKTAVLVERIIGLIKNDEKNIDKFLIVTFTNAAASGMKQKIQKSLVKAVQEGEGNTAHLRRQLNLLNKSSISTIHSFCIDVVRKNFHIIGVDPNFRIGDPNEVDIILMDSVDEVLEGQYGKKTQGFVKLVEGFTRNRGDGELVEIIKNMYRFIQSCPEPLEWLENSTNMLNMTAGDMAGSAWMEAIRENTQMLLDGGAEALIEAAKLCNAADGPYVYLDSINEDMRNVQSLSGLLQGDFEGFVAGAYGVSHPKLKALRGESKENCSEEKQNEVKSLRDEYKKIIESIKKAFPRKSMDDYGGDLNYMYSPMHSMYEIIAELDEVFKRKKMEKAIVDFNDVEHYAIEILKNEEVSASYRKKYDYIFIDEYQDSNILQETLIEKIKRSNNVFMVGDVKQSIYRFRLADPGIFNDKYNRYKHTGSGTGDGDTETINVRVDLNRNFRSRKEILDGTNYIFKNIMSEKMGEVRYSEDEFLNYGADFDAEGNNLIEIHIIDKSFEDEETDDEIKSMKSAEMEARYCALKIKEFLKQSMYVPDKKIRRSIEYRDIVILMRSVSGWAQIFEEVFAEEEIPFYFDGGSGYFETIEIQVVLNLLRVIDNIRQDVPLISVMRSPMFKFTTEELIKIRVFSPRLSYIDGIYAYKNKADDELSHKLKEFIEKIEDWKKRCRFSHLNDFIWDVLIETGYYYFVGVLPKGKMRQANLRMLADKALEFEKTSMRGLFNFLKFIDRLNVVSGDMSTAKTIGENDNVVRLMSIHKSKGLEFPVVFLCGTAKKFNRADVTKNILVHKDYGIAPKYINHVDRVYKETFPRMAVKNVIKKENLSEEMRILYVAMTRASGKLIAVGSVADLSSRAKKWRKGPSLYNIYSGDSFIDWICMSLYGHRDFKGMREFLGDEGRISSEDLTGPLWSVSRISPYNIKGENERNNDKTLRIKEISEFKNKSNSSCTEEINRKLSFIYKYESSVNVPTKMSVTDLRVMNDYNKIDSLKYNIPALREIPVFKEKKDGFTRAEVGTIVHFVMQHLNLEGKLDINSITVQMQEMVLKKMLTEKEAEAVNPQILYNFFNSDIGRRLLKSPEIKREVPFVIKKPANEIISSLNENDVIMIQGIIDCYFFEGAEVVIIDYKTDAAANLNPDDVKNKYRPQILSYKDAVEKITGKKVKECYLCLLESGEAILM